MTQNINGGGSRTYNLTIPALSDNADIVTALKLYHYGSDIDSDPVSANSMAGYLATKMNLTDINAKGDILVGTANDTVATVSFPGGVTNDYMLVTDLSTPSGVKWDQTNRQEATISYVMGLY